MPLSSVRLPPDVAFAIESLANASGISADAQTEKLLRSSLDALKDSETLLEAARRISAMTPEGVVQTPAETIIREIRDQ